MATRIIEYGGRSAGDYPVVPADHYVTKQPAMTATASSARSAAFNDATTLVCVQSDEAINCEVDGTATPTATADSYVINAAAEQWFKVVPGAKVAIKTV